ncbi:MAG: hypothetical protein LBE33_01035 [Zoogloeaceae bacterium]|jgi:hypothetical protein|nr:hypothetical protein [Zoogloeaceae bacterium]
MTSNLIYQRIRNRVIEELESIVQAENMCPSYGVNELVNSWEDWVPIPMPKNYFSLPVFTAQENELLYQVGTAFNEFCKVTPKVIEDDAAAILLPQWLSVVSAARSALSVMRIRGKMSEEHELFL